MKEKRRSEEAELWNPRTHLVRWAADQLRLPPDEAAKTLSILDSREAFVLSIMFTAAELAEKMDYAEGAEVLRVLATNHLLHKISVAGAGRKDMKELVRPGQYYTFYPAWPAKPPEEIKGDTENERKKRFRLF